MRICSYRYVWIALIIIYSQVSFAQKDSIESGATIQLGGYADIFYSYDFNEPEDNYRLPYMVNHNRHNEFNVNLATIEAFFHSEKYRANLVLQAGTYVNNNYADADAAFRILKEANAGLALTKNKKLWLDAGIMVSHIGFESLKQRANLSLTRSFLAETIPYYLSGAKLTYSFNSKWSLMLMITNGWQRIVRVQGNSLMSFSGQLHYNPKDKLEFSWSTFIGTDDPDTTRRMRYFNDFFILYALNEKWNLHAGIDFGFQQKSKGSTEYDGWFVSTLLANYIFQPTWAIGARVEYISDVNNIVIKNPSPYQYSCWGFSGNLDFKPNKLIMARVEGRYLISQDEVFVRGDSFKRDDLFITLSLSIDFNKVIAL